MLLDTTRGGDLEKVLEEEKMVEPSLDEIYVNVDKSRKWGNVTSRSRIEAWKQGERQRVKAS